MGVNEIKDTLDWDSRKIDMVLERQKKTLIKYLKRAFGEYLYWEQEQNNLE